ncbi:MAG: GNAT family N-acetyltransferase [Alphaproteobacteria bacterium]|nr:GNAT family N-acetyltransferase [Alphaproteobacteria bacterium]
MPNATQVDVRTAVVVPSLVSRAIFAVDEIRCGDLEVRLASHAAEIDAAQALRYSIFYEEMKARPSADMARLKRDFDAFDLVCDHLIVCQRDIVIGTYRLIRRAGAELVGQFYAESEFDIEPVRRFPGSVLELGRSCVAPAHRQRATLHLLWRGIAAYVRRHGIGLMFGCASLPGIDPEAHALALSYLHHAHLAPPELRPHARAERRGDMDRMPADAIDRRAAPLTLPPLVRGCLRPGGLIGDGAVIDHQFNTIDVCLLVRTDGVAERYLSFYERGLGGPLANTDGLS